MTDIQDVLNRAECLVDQDTTEARIKELAQDINNELTNPQRVLCILTGGIVFTGKLLSYLSVPTTLDYLHATRYRGETLGTEVEWVITPHMSLEGEEVLIVDDIYDEGPTLQAIIEACYKGGAKLVRTVMLVNKIHDRKVKPDFQVDYVGFELPDKYLFGYGMDYKNYLRNAPGIYAADEQDI